MLVAVDTGGTKTLVSAFYPDGTPGESYRFATPKDEEEYIAKLLEVLHEKFAMDQLDCVVIGVPCMVKDNEIVWCANLGWEGFDVAAALTTALRCPVWVENDANLAGLAEARTLLQPLPLVLYVTISTGIGTGIIVDGTIPKALGPSEAGHMVLEYDGQLRSWESFASGRAIKATYGSFARDIEDPKIWQQIADKISRGLLALVPTLQPDTIIIGGSIGTYFANYEETLNKLLHDQLPAHIVHPTIRQAVHPEEAVIYGCYYYGTSHLDI